MLSFTCENPSIHINKLSVIFEYFKPVFRGFLNKILVLDTAETFSSYIIYSTFFVADVLEGPPNNTVEAGDIKHLLDFRVPIATVAKRLGISRSTLYNKMKNLGIEPPKYSDVDRADLTRRIQTIKKDHPNCGEKVVSGHLHSCGLHVQRAKVRQVIREVDPEGVVARRRRALKRREYSVPCPLYLWHIDGNHKLIRYRIVIHVGIDGYSRSIVFIDANDNNRSATVGSLFLQAVETYGYPINIRTDLGGENVLVWGLMHSHWGTERKSVIVGSSEDNGLLDINNETDMFCLHYVLLPRVKKLVKEFAFAHNNHAIRTEGNLTPLQLLHLNSHLTQLHRSTISSIPGSSATESFSNLSVVNVPRTTCPLNDEEFGRLQQTIDPISDIPFKEAFNNVLQFVGCAIIERQL